MKVTAAMIEAALNAPQSGGTPLVGVGKGWDWEGTVFHSYDEAQAVKRRHDMRLRIEAAIAAAT